MTKNTMIFTQTKPSGRLGRRFKSSLPDQKITNRLGRIQKESGLLILAIYYWQLRQRA